MCSGKIQVIRENIKCKNESVFVNSKQQKYKNEKQFSKEKELFVIQFFSRRFFVWLKDYMIDYKIMLLMFFICCLDFK